MLGVVLGWPAAGAGLALALCLSSSARFIVVQPVVASGALCGRLAASSGAMLVVVHLRLACVVRARCASRRRYRRRHVVVVVVVLCRGSYLRDPRATGAVATCLW